MRLMIFRIGENALLLAGLLVAGWTAVGQTPGQDLQANEQQNSVHGTVINAVTRAPIARALVYSLDNRFAMLTNNEGRFEFTLPKEDSQEESGALVASYIVTSGGMSNRLGLMARKPGFLDDRRDSGEIEASSGNEITISLMPESLIAGRVTLSTNDPATGVTVQIFSKQVRNGLPRWVPGPSVRANSAGEFRFAELQAGSYKLLTHELMDNDPVATVPGGLVYGFPPVYYPGAEDFAAAAPIELLAGQTFEADLSLTHQPYYDVKIPVANREANGAEGQRISAGTQGARIFASRTDDAIEGMLPNGNYVVEGEVISAESAAGTVNIKVAGGTVGRANHDARSKQIDQPECKRRIQRHEKWNSFTSWSDGRHTYSSHGARASCR